MTRNNLKYNKKVKCDGPTDRRTDRRTDKAGCRVACTRLKIFYSGISQHVEISQSIEINLEHAICHEWKISQKTATFQQVEIETPWMWHNPSIQLKLTKIWVWKAHEKMTVTVFVAICHETSCLSSSISLASLSSLLPPPPPPPPPPPHLMSILSSPPKMSVTKSYSFSSFSRRWSTCPSLVKWDTAKGQCISSTSPHAHFVLCPNSLFSLPSLLDKNVLSLRNHQIWSPVINVQMCFTVFLWTLFSMFLHVFFWFSLPRISASFNASPFPVVELYNAFVTLCHPPIRKPFYLDSQGALQYSLITPDPLATTSPSSFASKTKDLSQKGGDWLNDAREKTVSLSSAKRKATLLKGWCHLYGTFGTCQFLVSVHLLQQTSLHSTFRRATLTWRKFTYSIQR